MTIMPSIKGYRAESFAVRDKKWIRYHASPAKSDDAWICAVDPGQSVDPTALIICHHIREVIPWNQDDGIIDYTARTLKQRINESYHVLHAERIALKTDYRDVIAHIRQVMQRPPLVNAEHSYLVIDEGGIGRALADELGDLRPIRVCITAGTDVHQLEGDRRFSVPKERLTSVLDIALHLETLKFPKDMAAAPQIAEEFKDFRKTLSATGRATYQARVGERDDLVLACGLGVWWAGERHTRLGFCRAGPLRGLC